MNITIEQLTSFSIKDAEEIKRLAAKIGTNAKPLSDDAIKEMLASTNIHLLVAREEESQKIAGMITLIVYRIPYVRKAYLDDLVVDETYRGQGIGSQLAQEALAMAKSLGASYTDLTSRPSRVASNKLYEKLGFKKRDTNVYRVVYDYPEV